MWRRYLGSACARSHDCIWKVVSQDPSVLRQSGCFVMNTSAPMPLYARVPGQKAKSLVTTVHILMPDGNGSGEGPEDPREPFEVDKGRCYDVAALRLGQKLNDPRNLASYRQLLEAYRHFTDDQQFIEAYKQLVKQRKLDPEGGPLAGVDKDHLGAAAAPRCYDVAALRLGRKLNCPDSISSYQQQLDAYRNITDDGQFLQACKQSKQQLDAYAHITDDGQFLEAYKQLDPKSGPLAGVDKEELFRAQVEMNGKVYHLGYFPSAAAAARCYDVAALRLGRKVNYPDNMASYRQELEAYRHITDDQQFIEAYLRDLKRT